MPHCVIEYARGIEQQVTPQALVSCVQQGAVNSDLFDEESIKTRCLAYEHFKTGTGDMDFVHVTVSILSGRTDYQKSRLASSILQSLSDCTLKNVSITVDVRDINQEVYAKVLIP